MLQGNLPYQSRKIYVLWVTSDGIITTKVIMFIIKIARHQPLQYILLSLVNFTERVEIYHSWDLLQFKC